MSRNFPKYKYGDKVETEFGKKGVVKSICKTDGEFMITVSYDEGSSSVFKEAELSFTSDFTETKKEVHIGTICPMCQTKFKLTNFGAKVWKDCIPCGKTAEELCTKAAEPEEDDQLDFGLWDSGDWKTY